MNNHKELRERLRKMADSNVTLYSPNGIRAILDLIDRFEREKEELEDLLVECRTAAGFGTPDDPMNEFGKAALGSPDEIPAFIANQFSRLKAENEGLREDAERYRWLSENAEIATTKWLHDGNDPVSTKEPLDAAIDAARKEEG